MSARARAFIHSFIHAFIHACTRASPPTILREPSSSSSTHRLPRHALRQQHPPHGFRRGRDALHQHAVHERSERASSRHPPSSRRRVRRDRWIESNRIESTDGCAPNARRRAHRATRWFARDRSDATRAGVGLARDDRGAASTARATTGTSRGTSSSRGTSFSGRDGCEAGDDGTRAR